MPVIQWFPTQNLFFHHYAYFTLFFLSGFLATIIWQVYTVLSQRLNQNVSVSFLSAIIILITGTLTLLTWKQNSVWSSEVSFWEDAYLDVPNSAKINYNLGLAYYRNQQFDKALIYLKHANELKPNQPSYVSGLLNALLGSGNQELFIEAAQAYSQLNHYNLQTCPLIKQVLINHSRTDLNQVVLYCL